MNSTNPSSSVFNMDSSTTQEKEVRQFIRNRKVNKKLLIAVGIIAGVIIITTIVLLAVLIPKNKKKEQSKWSSNI